MKFAPSKATQLSGRSCERFDGRIGAERVLQSEISILTTVFLN